MNVARQFDFVIYGATGLAGSHVVKHFLTHHPAIKIAIAGRNKSKLEQLAVHLNASESSKSKIDATSQILVASSDNIEELVHILSKAKVCLACAGPYRHVGKNVVEAAILAKTDYLDLCGEPQFYDDMLTTLNAKAIENNVLVVSACAFDCVPAEMCYQFASTELLKKFPETPVTNVEIVHTFEGIKRVNATTFHAAVDGFHASYTGELKQSRKNVKECFPQLLALEKAAKNRPDSWKKYISTPGMTSPTYHDFTNSYLLKFMGADASCIFSSDRYLRLHLGEQPTLPYLSVCFALQQKKHAYTFLGYGAVFALAAKFSWGCKMLHSNPALFTNGFFTPGGPTDEELKDGKFATYGTAYGLSEEQRVRVKISGGEPGYIATSAMMCALGMTVCSHRKSLKFSGGVLLPGAVFKDCNEVYDNLRQEGIQIDVMNDDATVATNDENV